MFLDCVVENKAEIRKPWRKFRRLANSLFRFQLSILIISVIFTVLVFFLAGLLITAFKNSHLMGNFTALIAVVLLVLAVLPIFIALGAVIKFTGDFAVPIMYLHGVSCVEAWRILLDAIFTYPLAFLLYWLFFIVITMGIGMIILAAIVLTCCCAACVLTIPYIGTVVFLPVLIFLRSYPLYFIRQAGKDFDVFDNFPADINSVPEAV